MEDFSAEEEEPWYDQQDLEQGEHGGGGRRAGCAPRPLSASPLLGGVTPGRAELHPAARTPMGDACGEWGRGEKGRAALEDRPRPAKTCKSRGNSLPLPLRTGAYLTQLAHPNLEAGTAQGP